MNMRSIWTLQCLGRRFLNTSICLHIYTYTLYVSGVYFSFKYSLLTSAVIIVYGVQRGRICLFPFKLGQT